MPEIENASAVQEYLYTKDPGKLTKFLKTMLWISLGVGILSLLSDIMQMNLLVSGSFSTTQAESNDVRQQVAGLLYLAAFIVTGIAFLRWTHRANVNCHGFGAECMEFTPGWSIGYYFIPVLNLYRPYLAMKEIWTVSKNPVDWQNESGGPLLGWWWVLWLASNFIGQISFRLSLRANTLESLQASTVVSIFSYLVDVPLNIIAVLLVTEIFASQERLVGNNA